MPTFLLQLSSVVIEVAGLGCLIAPAPPPAMPQDVITSVRVASEVDSDWRGLPGYAVEFGILETSSKRQREVRLVRTWNEFQDFDSQVQRTRSVSVALPTKSDVSVQSLNSYLNSVVASDLNTSQVLDDFAAINYKDCFELGWFKNVMSLPFIFSARQPAFWPSPPNITHESAWAEETAFECWLYIMSWQSHKNTSVFQPVLDAYTDLMPDWDVGHPKDNHDVWAPGVTREPIYPMHFTKTPVHFLPGGFKNSKNVRLSYLGKNKFSFLQADNLDAWIKRLAPVYNANGSPNRILDVGTGQCFSAFAFGRAYPDAEVIGIDLGAGQIRFCRKWAERDAVENVSFYHANAEDLPFESASFDIVQYTYVLHEMPSTNAFRVISEMWRVLKPGGILSGFEVPYFDLKPEREFLTDIFTWGKSWNYSSTQGPEPYFGEYENFNLVQQLKDANLDDPEIHCSTVFDMAITVVKSKGTTAHQCPQPMPVAGFQSGDLEGEWYEIGKIQTGLGAMFEGSCECTRLTYGSLQDGEMTVSNGCRKGKSSRDMTVVNATLTPTARGPGAFKEHFRFGPITNTVDYTFIAMDANGQEYAVEYDCSATFGRLSYCLHILARQPTFNSSVVNELLELATAQLNPYDVEFEATQQQQCWELAVSV